ncbi:unnamed protein product [Schistosoma rodhaini]|uniref:Uncharacterized protein n=1 Tax=Schistosoma rodhaini TaxID=6188 RepID=A0AA85G9U4_9TREM|nr:unnamed protein product [Schistosoma rodhaini]
MVRWTQKRARKSPSSSDVNSGLTFTPCSATPVAPDNSGSGLIPHMLLDDSMSNLIMSSKSRTDGIDLIESELAAVFKQLSDMRSKVESLAGSLLKHDDLKLELKTLSPLRLLLSRDIVPSELEDRIKVEFVIDSIASEVTKRIISRNNVIIYNIPDKVAIKTVRNSILKAANLQDSPCQCIRLNKKHQKYSCPILFRFDSHLLAERLIESEQLVCAHTKFKNARIVSDKTANQRLTQKRTINENNIVEVTTNVIAPTAEPTGAANLSHVSQCTDIPMQCVSLPLIPLVALDNQDISDGDSNVILSSVISEAKDRTPNSIVKAHKNTAKRKKNISIKKKVNKKPSSSKPITKNISTALPNKSIISETTLNPTHRKGGYKDTFRSNVTQEGHYNHHGSRPTIRQTAINQRAPWFPPYVINNKPARCNSYHHSRSGEDGILGYAPSTQPQHVGTCLNCPPKQIQQIIQPYQNKDFFFGLQRSLVPLALQFAHAIAHTIQQTH